jgi:hypothetical protein
LKSSGIIDRAVSALAATGQSVARHPRSVAAAVAFLLTGFGATAYGIAARGPDAADLPRRIVT